MALLSVLLPLLFAAPLFIAPSFGHAKSGNHKLQRCLSEQAVNMPDQKEVVSKDASIYARICYLPELKEVDGRLSPDYLDSILLLKKSKGKTPPTVLADVPTKISITWGRIDSLTLDKETPPYLSLRYISGEFCEGLVVFQTKPVKVLHAQGCESDESSCRMVKVLPKGKGKCLLELKCGSSEGHTDGTAKPKNVDIAC